MKKHINLNKIYIYFIGIGGISMSGLAKISLNLGAKIAGSDINFSDQIGILRSLGVIVNDKQDGSAITNDIDLIVYTGAIHKSNPELIKAKNLHIKCIERSKFLGIISKEYREIIAISGSHGKTTTTAMIGHIFQITGHNPTIHLGGVANNYQYNTIIGTKDMLILEACEYRESFKYLHPSTTIITNIDADHLDYYKDINAIKKAFSKFAKHSKCLITNSNIKHKNECQVYDVYKISGITFDGNGYDYWVYKYGKRYFKCRLNMIGRHNIENALFAIAVADRYNIPKSIIKRGLASFTGVARRYEKIGKIGDSDIIIDYAHHPTEILNLIRGVESVYKKTLYIFQPHTYSRTKKLFNEFVSVFDNVKNLIIYPTYAAREEEIVGGRAYDLYKALPRSIYVNNFDELIAIIKNVYEEYESILVLGAGDLAETFRRYLNTK